MLTNEQLDELTNQLIDLKYSVKKELLSKEQGDELVAMYLEMMNVNEVEPEEGLFLQEYAVMITDRCTTPDNFDMLVALVEDLVETKCYIVDEKKFYLGEKPFIQKYPVLCKFAMVDNAYKTNPGTIEHVLLKLFDFDTAIGCLTYAVDMKNNEKFIENALKYGFGLEN